MGALAVGAAHTCALDSSGDVSCWGDNSSGQFGDGSFVGSNVPVFGGVSGMTAIEILRSHSVLLTLMGFTGIIVVMMLAKIYPMV